MCRERQQQAQGFKYLAQGKAEARGVPVTISHGLLYLVAAGLLSAKKWYTASDLVYC